MQESEWMRRRSWLLAAVALVGCGKVAELPPDVFPEMTAGGWKRVQVREIDPSESPDPVPRNEIERGREAFYEGTRGDSQKIQTRVYRLGSEAMGVQLAQRWRPSADEVFFASGSYFVVVKWQAADRAALQEFIRDLQQRLAKPAK